MRDPQAESPKSIPLRVITAVIRFLASLRLAVVTLTALIIVLAWATFIEQAYGSAASRFGVYRTGWFAGLGALLGTNVFFAAAVRFPWKRHQTGFVITHAGILVLLTGSMLSALHGIDAQMRIYETDRPRADLLGGLAFEDTMHFELTLPDSGSNDPAVADRGAQIVRIPFHCGPFNWRDYHSFDWRHIFFADPGRLPWFPWRLRSMAKGVLYDRDGVRLEVLDYYSDSKEVAGGYLSLYAETQRSPDGGATRAWEPVELEIAPGRQPGGESVRPVGARGTLADGTNLTFTVSASKSSDEVRGFLESRPEADEPFQDQVVFFCRGVRYVVPTQDWKNGSKVPLGDSGLTVTLAQREDRLLALELTVEDQTGNSDEMLLFADRPEFNQQAGKLGVFGTYWVDTAAVGNDPNRLAGIHPQALAGGTQGRVDLLQSADGKLYYRYWKAPRFVASGTVPLNGSPFQVGKGSDSLRLAVRTLLPYDLDRPERKVVVPRPFRKRRTGMEQPRALVRLTLGSQTKESWLAVLPQGATEAFSADELIRVSERDQAAGLILRYDAVDVGFRLRLVEFQRKMDPGTTQPSHYASLVDMYVPKATAERFDRLPADTSEDSELRDAGLTLVQPRILITLNHPVNLSNPLDGRTYRLYQEAFNGPFRPGDPVFERVLGPGSAKSELYASILTVNYDPGRGLKYFGSLLIVGGILTMYRMRAYFFRRRTRDGVAAESTSAQPAANPPPSGDLPRSPMEVTEPNHDPPVALPRR